MKLRPDLRSLESSDVGNSWFTRGLMKPLFLLTTRSILKPFSGISCSEIADQWQIGNFSHDVVLLSTSCPNMNRRTDQPMHDMLLSPCRGQVRMVRVGSVDRISSFNQPLPANSVLFSALRSRRKHRRNAFLFF